jgi:hypothetical protein
MPGDSFMYDADRINDHILQNHEYSVWKDTKFESTGNDFTYILMSCLFSYKSKTLSHLRECLTRYKDVIRLNTNTKEKQMKMLEALYEIWGHSNIYLKMVIEILFNNYILDYMYLVEFIFSYVKEKIMNNVHFIDYYYQFIILDYIVAHSNSNMIKLRKQLTKEQENIAQGEAELQSEVLHKLESIEEYIERLKDVSNKLDKEIVDRFVELKENIKGLILDYGQLLEEKFQHFLRKA